MSWRATLWLRRGSALFLLFLAGASIGILLARWQSLLVLCLDWWHRHPLLAVLAAGTALLSVAGLLNLLRAAAGEFRAQNLWRKMLVSHRVLPYRKDVFLVRSGRFFVFTRGLLRPRTYCSSTFLEDSTSKEQEAVFEHEATHRSRRDPLRRTIWRLLAATLFFFPLVLELERAALTAEECLADSAALATGHDRHTLLAAVRRALRHGGTLPYALASAPFAAHPDLLVRCRILAGESVPRRTPPRMLLATLVVLAVMLGSITLLPIPSSATEQNICRELIHSSQRNSSMTPAWLSSAPMTDAVLFSSEP